MKRLARFVGDARNVLEGIIITMDTHPTVSIERTTFWRQGNGARVAPLTQITEKDVVEGLYLPRNDSLRGEVEAYLRALEAGGRYRLMVWPVHCVLGTWGHNIHRALAGEIGAWEEQAQCSALKVLKGMNPMTEQYSAVRAEVPRADDPKTRTNELLVAKAKPGKGLLLVAGEASSHCVAATMTDLLETLTADERRRVVMLNDCMSPIHGFESAAEKFFERATAQGVSLMNATQALAELLQPAAAAFAGTPGV
jgi:nicotinamidase-related amidase